MVRIVKPRTFSAREMYKFYCKHNPDKPVPYWMYKEVLTRVNKKASNEIIFGSVFNLGANLGYVLIRKIRRNFDKPKPDWGASNKIKKELIAKGITPKDQNNPNGEEWIKFYSDPWYLRWAWTKYTCKVKNQSVYAFAPTSNRSKTAGDNSLPKLGNKGKLVLANRLNPALHVLYEENSNFKPN